jgi:oligopeptide/dipeptide ABC transporter ATP-binding protein
MAYGILPTRDWGGSAVREQTAAITAASGGVSPLLDVRNLTTSIKLHQDWISPVDNVSFHVNRGEVLGLVGESGCGKSTTVLSVLRLVPPGTRISGTVTFESGNLLDLPDSDIRRMRGKDISMIFQEPMTALDPAFNIGSQLVETIRAHLDIGANEAANQAVEMLQRVGIPNAQRRMKDYPHQFSGGMRQRVMIAMALVLKPRLLIADEPTSALDVTIQAQILDLLAQLTDELDMSMILITHDLGVVYEIADRVAVMYAGEIVETGTVSEIFDRPQHPYTQGLLRSMPDLATGKEDLHVIPGRVPELWELPPGCRFAPRCPNRITHCSEEHPSLSTSENDHGLRCFNPTPFERR